MRDQVDRWHRERDYHDVTHAGDWHRAEQLMVTALQDGELTDAERDAWHERRDSARRGTARRG